MAAPAQRRALGALFFVLAALFGGIAFAAARARVWPVAAAAVALAFWLAGMAARGLRGR